MVPISFIRATSSWDTVFIFQPPVCPPASRPQDVGQGQPFRLPTAESSLLFGTPPCFLAAPLASLPAVWSQSQGHVCPFIFYDNTCIASFHLLWNISIELLMWYNIFKRWTFPPVPEGVSASLWNPHSTLNLSRGINGLRHFLSCLVVVVLWVVSRAAFYRISEHLTLQSLRFGSPDQRQ